MGGSILSEDVNISFEANLLRLRKTVFFQKH